MRVRRAEYIVVDGEKISLSGAGRLPTITAAHCMGDGCNVRTNTYFCSFCYPPVCVVDDPYERARAYTLHSQVFHATDNVRAACLFLDFCTLNWDMLSAFARINVRGTYRGRCQAYGREFSVRYAFMENKSETRPDVAVIKS